MTHLRNSSIRFYLASLMLAVAACTPPVDPGPRRASSVEGSGSAAELRLRWAQWQATRIRSYGFNLERGCFCTSEMLTPARVDVRDGRVVSVRARIDGRALPQEYVPTIDSLFRWAIREADGDGHVEVSYDPLLSYPVRLVIGTLANDAGVAYHVADLVPK
jgi:hypothetical protein